MENLSKKRRLARLAIRVSLAEKHGLQKLALERDLTTSQIVRHAIRRELSPRENPR